MLASVEQYELPLLRYAARMGLDLDLARDCVQHAFLQLCSQSPASLTSGAGPWLYRVVRNRAIRSTAADTARDPVRRAARRRTRTSQRHRAASDHPTAQRESDPGERSADRELYSLLRGLVAELPAATRELVLLWADGMSHRDIAEVTDRSEGNIRVQLHRAFARLREHTVVRRWLREDHSVEPSSLEARIALTR